MITMYTNTKIIASNAKTAAQKRFGSRQRGKGIPSAGHTARPRVHPSPPLSSPPRRHSSVPPTVLLEQRLEGGRGSRGDPACAGTYPIPSISENCWETTCSAHGNVMLSAANKSKSSFWANRCSPHQTNTPHPTESGTLLIASPITVISLISTPEPTSQCSVEIHGAGNAPCGLAMPFTVAHLHSVAIDRHGTITGHSLMC